MKKQSSTNRLLIKFVIKSVISTIFSIAFFSFVFSEIVYKLDLSTDNNRVFSIIIVFLCSACIAFISVLSIKNNGALMGIVSTLALLFYETFNMIFNDSGLVLFLIKLVLTLLTGALFGILATRKSNKFKVK